MSTRKVEHDVGCGVLILALLLLSALPGFRSTSALELRVAALEREVAVLKGVAR